MIEMSEKIYTLMDANMKPYQSKTPGAFGGNGRGKIYGRLDCPSALRAIAQGGYVEYRVFFVDEQTAIAAGFRPCGNCLREKYARWKEGKETK